MSFEFMTFIFLIFYLILKHMYVKNFQCWWGQVLDAIWQYTKTFGGGCSLRENAFMFFEWHSKQVCKIEWMSIPTSKPIYFQTIITFCSHLLYDCARHCTLQLVYLLYGILFTNSMNFQMKMTQPYTQFCLSLYPHEVLSWLVRPLEWEVQWWGAY
jgi:hypothetical protein